MKKTSATFELTFTEPALGMSPGAADIMEEYIASNSPTDQGRAEEVEAVSMDEALHKASTVFPKDEKGCFAWDYQVRGAIKEGLGVLIELGDIKISKWQHKKAVDSFVFVNPRRIYYMQSGNPCFSHETMSRPMRVSTMKGDRICIARSETLPVGTTMRFEVEVLESSNPKATLAKLSIEDIEKILEYGTFKGWGQWRGGGYGRYTMKRLK